MKKKIAILLILVLLGSSALWADGANVVGIVFGGLLTLGGVGVLPVVPPLFAADTMTGFIFLGISGALLGVGIPLLVHNISVQSKEGRRNAQVIPEAALDGLYLVNADGEVSTAGVYLASQNDLDSPKAKDSIFDHLLFGTDGRNTYLGVRFSW